MDSTEEFYIPRHLDPKLRFFFWPAHEAFTFIVAVFWGVMAGRFWEGLVIAFVAVSCLRRIERKAQSFDLRHFIYWHFPSGIFVKELPPSHIREWKG